MGDSLMTVQESVQMYCVKEQMTNGDGNKFNMSFEDWDIIGQVTTTVTVDKETVTHGFIITCHICCETGGGR